MAFGDDCRRAIEALVGVAFKRRRMRCDWCGALLAEENTRQYVDFCLNIGRVYRTNKPLPDTRMFCDRCAVGAVAELVDGTVVVEGTL